MGFIFTFSSIMELEQCDMYLILVLEQCYYMYLILELEQCYYMYLILELEQCYYMYLILELAVVNT
jgi:hypothetical protein